MTRTVRQCSKVLLVDEFDRVLLLNGADRSKPHEPSWWFPVGGGLDLGETHVEAAIRETHEETGLLLSDPGPVVFTRSVAFEFEGQAYEQEESFFLVRVQGFMPTPHQWTQIERATIRGVRWWPIEDLRSTTEVVFPENLADNLSHLLM